MNVSVKDTWFRGVLARKCSYELVGVKSVSLSACVASKTIQIKWIKSTIAGTNNTAYFILDGICPC
jgi:hypothetical protein